MQLPRAIALAGALIALVGCSEAYWTGNVREVRSLPPDSVLLTNADIRTVNRIQGFDRVLGPAQAPDGTPLLQGVPRRDSNKRNVLDAKGKPIIDNLPYNSIRYIPRQFVCAEPSPDIARVVQAAFSGAGSVKVDVANPTPAGLVGAKGVDVAADARVDLARSEAIAQLTRRIATIQLLRDGLYRACEAYANGAISRDIYTTIISRYDKMMITMLLAEMASGTVSTSAGAGGTAQAGIGADQAATLAAAVVVAQKRADDARTAAQTAADDALAADNAKTKTDAGLAAATDTSKAALQTAQTTATTDQKAKQNTLTEKKRFEKEAETDLAAAKQAQTLAAGRLATAATPQPPAPPGPSPSAEVAAVLYNMQAKYIDAPNEDTAKLICLNAALHEENMRSNLNDYCARIMAVTPRR